MGCVFLCGWKTHKGRGATSGMVDQPVQPVRDNGDAVLASGVGRAVGSGGLIPEAVPPTFYTGPRFGSGPKQEGNMDGHYTVERDRIEDLLTAEGVQEWVALCPRRREAGRSGGRHPRSGRAGGGRADGGPPPRHGVPVRGDGRRPGTVSRPAGGSGPRPSTGGSSRRRDAARAGQRGHRVRGGRPPGPDLVGLAAAERRSAIREIMQDPDESDEEPAAALRVDA